MCCFLQKIEEYYKDVAAILQEVENLQERLATNRKLRANEIENVLNSSLDMTESIKILIRNAIDEGMSFKRIKVFFNKAYSLQVITWVRILKPITEPGNTPPSLKQCQRHKTL